MDHGAIAICSNPDCTRHAGAPAAADLPEMCPTCGSTMVARCWKCDTPLTDPFSSYCGRCGVPLKRILPRAERRGQFLAICGNPECDGAVEARQASSLPSRCPKCGSRLVAHCWKCGAGIVDMGQHYCQVCGVPLKRHLRPA